MIKKHAIILMEEPTQMSLAEYFGITRQAVCLWPWEGIPDVRELFIRKDIFWLAGNMEISLEEAFGLCDDKPPISQEMIDRLEEVDL